MWKYIITKISQLSHLFTRYNLSKCLKICAKVWSHIPRQRVSAEPIEAYGGSSIGPILHSVQPTTVSVSVYCCKWFHMSTISAALMVNKSLLNRKRKTEKSTLRNLSIFKFQTWRCWFSTLVKDIGQFFCFIVWKYVNLSLKVFIPTQKENHTLGVWTLLNYTV